MTRANLPAVCALVTLAAAAALDGARQDPPRTTFRSGAAVVMVDATVRDRTRRALTGLSAKDFEVRDNGVLQQVDDVSYGKLPIDVTVALDVSHSVTGDLLDRLRQAVRQLMGDLERGDRLRLVLFNMRVMRTIDFTTDVRAVERAIRAAAAGGGTALLDAVSVALVSGAAPERRQLIVVFTDGSDTSSTTSPATLTAVAQRTRATLAFVVPSSTPVVMSWGTQATVTTVTPSAGFRPAARPLQGLFNTLARETGGSVFPVAPSANLSAAFSRVLSDFRSAYVLYYTPRGVDRTGYHDLEVAVRRDGAVVQARRGYFGS